jgi:hypothetical protein
MKILILMSYYNRPILVRRALQSILVANEHHKDWELLFGDDSSDIPGKPIVEEIMKDHLDKIVFAHSNMTLDDKIEKGLLLGHYCNEAIKQSDADIGIMFSDDDELHPLYLKNLSEFFTNNPDVLYCWSMIYVFNPLLQKSNESINVNNKYNKHESSINPVNKVDATQVAWRLSCCKERGAWFADTTRFVYSRPWTKDTDKSFFENLHEKCGQCQRTGFVAQYKGVHDYQLLWHKNVGEEGLRAYHKMIKDNAGVRF